MVIKGIYNGVCLIYLREFDKFKYMKKFSVICIVIFLSGCNLTSKDFYTTEPILTGVIIGIIVGSL